MPHQLKSNQVNEAKQQAQSYGEFLSHQADVLKVLASPHGFQLEFHLSTKVSQALRHWGRMLTPANLQAYHLWLDLMADVVAQLPHPVVKDGTDGTLVDPYSRLRNVFSNGQTGKLPQTINQAWDVARSSLGSSVDSNYVNMLELLKWTGADISDTAMGDAYQKAYGSRTDPNQLIEELIDGQTTKLNIFKN